MDRGPSPRNNIDRKICASKMLSARAVGSFRAGRQPGDIRSMSGSFRLRPEVNGSLASVKCHHSLS